jgi:hypothetical protein
MWLVIGLFPKKSPIFSHPSYHIVLRVVCLDEKHIIFVFLLLISWLEIGVQQGIPVLTPSQGGCFF